MLKKGLISFSLILLFRVYSIAQDPEFSQFYSAPLYINPALAGISYGPRVNLNYRNQWPQIEKGYTTYAASFDMHIDALYGGLGVLFWGDRIANGILNTYSINLMYSYQLKLSRKFGIKLGAQGGYTQRSVDWASLSFSDMIDPIFGFQDEFGNANLSAEPLPNNAVVRYGDMGAGFVAFSPFVFGGLAVHHLIRPKESFTGEDTRVPLRVTVHAGGDIDLAPHNRNRNVILSPNILLAQQSNFTQLNLGTYVLYNIIYGGLWFRHTFSNSDAVIGVVGIKISYVRVGYSYDYTISELKGHTGGAHEISLTFKLDGDDNSLNPKRRSGQLACPTFLNF